MRPAAAKIGANVETEPSINPREARLDLLEHDGITTTIRQRCIFQSHWESSGVYDNAEH